MQPDAPAWQETNKVFWDQAANRWRTLDEPPPEDVAALLGDLDCPAGSLLLDAGCGTGLWSVALARAGCRVCGVDLSPGMLQAARERAGGQAMAADRLALVRSTLAPLPFADGSFDGIVCRNMLDFVPGPGAALLELGRVLKSGRCLVLTTLGAYSPAKRFAWRSYLPDGGVPHIANHILPWEVEALLQELGWAIPDQRPGFGPAASGMENSYTADDAARLRDRILQQTVASWWHFVARKPSDPVRSG